jgi:hypothetical protein
MIVTAVLLEADGTTVVTGALDDAFDITWQSALNDPGWGQLSVPWNSTGADEVIAGRFVQCLLDGVVVFHWQILRPPVVMTVSEEEEFGEVLTARGPGWIGGLTTALILPYGGLSNPLVPQVRQWNFATPNYDDSAWIAATEINGAAEINPDRYQLLTIIVTVPDEPDVETVTPAPAPLGWYVPEAFWIWGDADTTTVCRDYFRTTYTLADQSIVTHAATGDNFYTVYLQGSPILGDNENEACWQEHNETTFTMSPGTFGVAAVVENLEWPPAYVNPAGFLGAIFVPDAQGAVASLIKVTDDSWLSLHNPANEPGWQPGAVLIDILDEVQFRATIPHVSWTFTTTADSDSAAWSEPINGWSEIPNISVPVGGNVFDLLTRLENEAWLEYRSALSTMALEAYNRLGAGTSTTFEFEEGINIAELTFGDTELYFNRLMVKWGSRYQFVENSAAITANDSIVVEGTVTVDAASYADADRLGQVPLAESSDPQPSITLKFLYPETWREASLAAVNRGRPYEDFREGDYLLVQNQAGDGLESVRLLSLTVTQGDDGHAEISGELNRRINIPERERAELLVSLGMGVQGETRISIPVSTANAIAARVP